MKWHWKVLVGLCSLVLLLVILNIGLNSWIKWHLPKVINRENDSAYFIAYKELTFSLWDSYIVANEVVIVPKKNVPDSIAKNGIYGKVKRIEVRNFKLWDIVFNDKIRARSITVDQPEITMYKEKKREDIREAVIKPFDKIISVSDIYLEKGIFKIINVKNNKMILSVQNITAAVDGIVITEEVLSEKIPFRFRNYTLSCDSLYYHPNAFYDIKTRRIHATKTNLKLDRFEMLPLVSRRQFAARISKEKDLFTLFCKSIEVSKIEWGFLEKDLFVHADKVKLDQVSANIYRSKEPRDDFKKKLLYNKLLRDLEFDLKVDTLQMRNSIVEYEEEKSFEFGAGKVSFSGFNLTATNICSGFKKQKLSDVKIRIKCNFMKTAPLRVDWRFNVLDRSDGFKIRGHLNNFDAVNMTRFTKPYMNVKVKGVLDEVYFNFKGNDRRIAGDFAVKYDDLKFTIYRKNNRQKENKLLTLVSRIFVKKNTKEQIKNTNVAVERIPEKSFYNLLWRGVEEGLKEILT